MSEPTFEFVPGSGPLLISFPHSGTIVPAHLAERLRPQIIDLPDTDWFVPQLYEWCAALGASALRATHTRYLVDLNRPPDGAALYPGQRETTVCPTETFDGEPLYREGAMPTSEEISDRLALYWQPYHDRIASLTRSMVERHGFCILWDAHSIRSTVPGLFSGKLPDLNLGTADGHSCAAAAAELVLACLRRQAEFSFVIDGRFKGGYITRRYGNPSAGVHALQMEIAQSAYLEEARSPVFDAARARPLSALLRQILASLVAFSP